MTESPEATYDRVNSSYDRLRLEAEFTIGHYLTAEGIKIHSVISRLKSRESYLEKAKRLEAGAFDPVSISDLAGIRVVCLYLDDLARVGQVLRNHFEVRTIDDKISSAADDVFGYMSVHYVLELSPLLSGPRYDGLHGLRFEVQVRTILMDAWANVSHHLDYKVEASVPSKLRRDFYALSGLFYVADQSFQHFATRAGISAKASAALVDAGERDVEINLDTVEPLVRLKFPDRRRAKLTDIADLVGELFEAGYQRLAEVDRDIEAGRAEAEAEDAETDALSGSGGFFQDIGMVRTALSAVSDSYKDVLEREYQEQLREENIQWAELTEESKPEAAGQDSTENEKPSG